ncbi:cation-translocating P-type ATPase [Anaeromyxobacter oryzae]|uniref:ATPase n=1 Tax=Anaeromyxobacter oryzae TaxID=2918170 RepID=A0ABM7WU35_9BACT|nr:cation-transporting P-type ATPase [Anaeromyxobacter oryzae]BDG03004.1 ATPase [Anaeromyxobacter oryzae]
MPRGATSAERGAAPGPDRRGASTDAPATASLALPAPDVAAALGTREGGLTEREAGARLASIGRNELPPPRRRSGARRALAQVTHPMAILLWAAAGLSFASAMPQLGWAIVLVVVVNGAVGAWQEHRGDRALAALEALMPRRARVLRGGGPREVAAAEVVPGDVLVLAEGDRVVADARIVQATLLRLDVSLLTGESLPVDRDALPCLAPRAVADASCAAPAGATVVTGRARAVVFATGPRTELGRIARLATATRRAPSTLELQVARIVRTVTALAVGMGVAVFALLHVFGAPLWESLLFAIGIIVANVPEGLLPAITITLAANVQRMARRHALVSRLSAVETLGAVDVICTDKTGTLTENALSVERVWTPGPAGRGGPAGSDGPADAGAAGRRLLAAAALANDAHVGPTGGSADPIDRALLAAAAAARLEPAALRRACPRLAEAPFDARRRRMSVVVRAGPPLAATTAGPVAIVKGAPLAVLERCTRVADGAGVRAMDDAGRAEVLEVHDALAARGLRLVAVAIREDGGALAGRDADAVERDLTLLGLVALADPPRAGVGAALAACARAGVRVTIVTGDHGLTARAVAEAVGLWTAGWRVVDGSALEALAEPALEALLEASAGLVFARVTPEQKLRLVRAYQRLGHVVAVTGDGVNDAPALHAANVGVAMGRAGTDVARAAADVVLLDDDFSTIVAAVEGGRTTFANVRKFLAYVLTSNVPEIAPFLAMVVLHVPPALGILQILAIDLGTDMLPALALGAEPPEPGLMAGPPRARGRRVLDVQLLLRAYGWLGVVEAAACLAAFFAVWWRAGYGLGALQAVTPALLAHAAPAAVAATYREATSAALAAIVCCQVGNVLACRSERTSALRLARPGRLLAAGIAVEVALLLAIVYLPPLQAMFGTAPLPGAAWPWLLACAPATLLADEVGKGIVRGVSRLRRGRVPRRGPER